MGFSRASFGVGAGSGIAAVCVGAFLMGQSGSQPPPRDPTRPSTTQPSTPSTPSTTNLDLGSRGDYFVTGDANHASLWMRSGSSIRWVSSADGMDRTPGERNRDLNNPVDRPAPK